MNGFFSNKDIETIYDNRSLCLQCGLYRHCISPKMKPTGKGKKGIFILAEGPGRNEDEEGEQLIGKSGQLLRSKLDSFGIDLDEDCIKMNAINCRTYNYKEKKLENRTPTSQEIHYCRGMVLQEINRFKPKLIILLGGPAVESIIGARWKKKLGGITKWRGWTIPEPHYGAWVCPTYHPSFVQREERNPACELIFKQDLDRALGMLDVTFPKYPAIEDGIRIIQDDRETINYLKKLLNNPPELAAFDYEASGLKPHLHKHYIVCCSIATDSNSATSFLMNNDIVRSLFIRFLTNEKIGKIGANIKFEHNWSREKFGVEVSNWIHDICLAQHIADNRSNICSLKFITYVYRGISDYASHITPYLETKSKSGNAFNKIDSAPLNELQLYNGIDSKETFSIGIEQMENMI